MTELQPLRRTIRGGRPFFFRDPAIDKVLNMVVTLAGEVWALRERLAAVEAINVGQGSLSASEVDEYEFTPEQDARLGSQRKEFIESLFRVLEEHVEAATAKSPKVAAGLRESPGVFGARIAGVPKKKPRASPAAVAVKPSAAVKAKARKAGTVNRAPPVQRSTRSSASVRARRTRR